jgi:hypothetical protein
LGGLQRRLAALGVKNLHIGTNGEFFLRNDWEEIWSQAASMAKVLMTTNGTVLDRAKLEAILQYRDRIGGIKVSLNALTPETWSLASGAKNRNLFDTAMKAVEILADNYVPVVASMIVTAENHHEVEGFVKYWVERQISVNISNELSSRELLSGDPEVDNSLWPYYSCEAINSVLTVDIDGNLGPCCRTSYCFDDANSLDLPLINIDEPVEAVKSKWFEALKSQAYKKACRTCTLFYPRLDRDSDKKSTLYGYKGHTYGLGFQINRRKKKPVPERIVAEMNRFGRRIKNKLSKF